jgi:hypothetical protein
MITVAMAPEAVPVTVGFDPVGICDNPSASAFGTGVIKRYNINIHPAEIPKNFSRNLRLQYIPTTTNFSTESELRQAAAIIIYPR